MKFLADENFPFPAISALRSQGYDVASIAEKCAGSSDDVVAQICTTDMRVLLTFDKDFGELVFRHHLSAGSSILLFRIEPDPIAIVEHIKSLIERQILRPGVFCVVTNDRVRVRPLRAN